MMPATKGDVLAAVNGMEADIARLSASVDRVLEERAAMSAVIVRLRMALAYYADDDEGWAEVEHADAYEASRVLVADHPDEGIA